jgi:hypothetical protein
MGGRLLGSGRMSPGQHRLSAPFIAVVIALAVGCDNAVPPASSTAALPALPNFIPAGATSGPGEDAHCDSLLTLGELQAATGGVVRGPSQNQISCFWLTPTRNIQLVLQTGPSAHRWFQGLTQPGDSAGMHTVAGYDFEALAKDGSFGGYAPGRAALLHSAIDPDAAARLIRLVLTRL